MSYHLYEKIADGVERVWKIDEALYCQTSPYQNILIGRTAQGITLFCNAERQSTELTQLIYHENQLYPALMLQPHPKKALVIGCSEGCVPLILAGAVKDCQITHVDIDEQCVKACAKYLPYGYGMDHFGTLMIPNQINLIFTDGYEFLQKSEELYDLIVVDLNDLSIGEETAPGDQLYTQAFLWVVKQHLAEGGVFITQAGCSTYWRCENLKQVLHNVEAVFGRSHTVYWGSEMAEWSWALGLNDKEPNHCFILEMQHNLSEASSCNPQTIGYDDVEKNVRRPLHLRHV